MAESGRELHAIIVARVLPARRSALENVRRKLLFRLRLSHSKRSIASYSEWPVDYFKDGAGQ